MSIATIRTAGAVLTVATLTGALLTGCSSTPAASTASTTMASASSSTSSTTTTQAAPSSSTSSTSAAYTMAEVKKHNTASDCWSAIDNKVYDLTAWVNKHPGGAQRIIALCGTDGTAAFSDEHGDEQEPNQKLATFLLGPLS